MAARDNSHSGVSEKERERDLHLVKTHCISQRTYKVDQVKHSFCSITVLHLCYPHPGYMFWRSL